MTSGFNLHCWCIKYRCFKTKHLSLCLKYCLCSAHRVCWLDCWPIRHQVGVDLRNAAPFSHFENLASTQLLILCSELWRQTELVLVWNKANHRIKSSGVRQSRIMVWRQGCFPVMRFFNVRLCTCAQFALMNEFTCSEHFNCVCLCMCVCVWRKEFFVFV